MSKNSTFPLVDDVLNEIRFSDCFSRADLLSLALTCRCFEHPALAALWQSLKTDFPLVTLLRTLGITEPLDIPPQELVEFVAHRKVRSGWLYASILQSALSQHEHRLTSYQTVAHMQSVHDLRSHPKWGRFEMYARFVREIHICPGPATQMSSVWTELAALLPADVSILPGLRQATIYRPATVFNLASAEDRSQFVLLTPDVRSVDLVPFFNPDGSKAVAETLFARFPCVHEVALKYSTWLPLLSQFSYIRRLTVRQWDAHIGFTEMPVMGTWPALDSLEIFIEGFNVRKKDTQPPLPAPFSLPALKTLIIHDLSQNQALLPLLSRMDLPVLRTLAYDLDPFIEGDCVPQPRLSAIFLAYPHISELELAFSLVEAGAISATSQHVALSDVVPPLAPLKGLRVLKVTVQSDTFAYSSADILAIIAACPALAELCVEVEWDHYFFYEDQEVPGSGPEQPTSPSTVLEVLTATTPKRVWDGVSPTSDDHAWYKETATLDVLADLARVCPALRVLHLPRTALDLGALDAAVVRPHGALRELRLGIVECRAGQGAPAGAVDVDPAWAVCAFLRTVFPHVGRGVGVRTVSKLPARAPVPASTDTAS
ncbi:uncharacterized protein BXZ73DRAFT_107585 [Epithele typhae]|uniref:uncharacterized protein n=1 Tax=Epithele typhae TaxID=378194 RepID=UPI00200827A1|nr:uncharacterized protein BXZ73DRAFT_107585 [Epithele typhae]KAH9912141.1 hypothetical protein BXZ73DRAFT_107585 [Epithele typhae]